MSLATQFNSNKPSIKDIIRALPEIAAFSAEFLIDYLSPSSIRDRERFRQFEMIENNIKSEMFSEDVVAAAVGKFVDKHHGAGDLPIIVRSILHACAKMPDVDFTAAAEAVLEKAFQNDVALIGEMETSFAVRDVCENIITNKMLNAGEFRIDEAWEILKKHFPESKLHPGMENAAAEFEFTQE